MSNAEDGRKIVLNENEDGFEIVIPKDSVPREEVTKTFEYLQKCSQRMGGAEKPVKSGAKKFRKIMVVDDFATARNLITQMLVDDLKICASTDVFHARNGKEALAKLGNEKDFDFIISDWNMPEMTGYELLVAVRSNAALKAIPFLMITAEGEIGNVKKALQAGVSGYVLKPFNTEKLSEKLKQMKLI